MIGYGGSCLCYAIAFELPRALRAIMMTGHIDLNDKASAAKLSGFMPVHVAVANSSQDMFDQLTQELPPELRSREDHLTLFGNQKADSQVFNLTCLQVRHALMT